jgi:hypothetical protein
LRRWHRLFGLLLSDHLANSPFSVVLEIDLSHKQQFLDVVVVRRRPGRITHPLPDGLDDLAEHNLITFQSYWEPLDDWALKELTGHYVNYRKQVSPRGRLQAEAQFRMIAVCARRPRDLFAAVPPDPLRPGVYGCRRGTDIIRVVVVAELLREERNALLHLFSAAPEQVQYGAEHYRVHAADTSTIVNKLFAEYRVEGLPMPYTMEDFKREIAEGLWPEPEERVPVQEVLKRFSPEERLAGLPAEEILKHFSAEERLAGLSADQIEAYLKGLGKKATSRKKRPKRRG